MSNEGHDSAAESAALVRLIMQEINELHFAGEVRAIGVAIIDGAGDVKTRIAIGEGLKLPLLAATVCLQHDVVRCLTVLRDYTDGR